MATFDYATLRTDKVPALVRKYGQAMTLRLANNTSSGKAWVVTTGQTPVEVWGLDLDFETRVDGVTLQEKSLVQTGDRRILIEAVTMARDPAPDDQVLLADGTVYTVIRVPTILKPAGTVVLYELHCRK